MTAYAAFLLALAVLAPLPWIALYRLDRRCAEGVVLGEGEALRNSLSADHRSLVAPDQADSALGQPGGRRSPT